MAATLDAIYETIELTLREKNFLAGVTFEKDYADLSLTLRLHKFVIRAQENGTVKADDGAFCESDPYRKSDLNHPEPLLHSEAEDDFEETWLSTNQGLSTIKTEIRVEKDVIHENATHGQLDSGSRLNKCSVVLVKLDGQFLENQLKLKSTNEIHLKGETGLRPNKSNLNDAHEPESKTGGRKKISVVKSTKKKSKSDADKDYNPYNWNQTKKKKKVKKRKPLTNNAKRASKLSVSSPSKTNNLVKENLPLKHVCNICGKESSHKWTLDKHMMTHSTEKPFACSLCDFRTKFEGCLRKHMMIHMGLKPYKCSLCDLNFRSRGDVNTHMKGRHGHEKKYSCKHCEFKAKTKAGVRAHVRRMHLPSTVYKCDLCGKRTMDEYIYKKHMLAHKSNISFNCQCGLRYTSKPEFDRHFKRAHGPEKKEIKKYRTEPCVCRLCGRSYTMITGLRKHRDRHHPGELFHHCSHCLFSTDIKAEFLRHLSSLTHLERLSNGSNPIVENNATLKDT